MGTLSANSLAVIFDNIKCAKCDGDVWWEGGKWIECENCGSAIPKVTIPVNDLHRLWSAIKV